MGTDTENSRRQFISRALAFGVAIGSVVSSDSIAAHPADTTATDSESLAVTPRTMREAEKLHSVQFTRPQREVLASNLPAQVEVIESIKRTGRPLDLDPC